MNNVFSSFYSKFIENCEKKKGFFNFPRKLSHLVKTFFFLASIHRNIRNVCPDNTMSFTSILFGITSHIVRVVGYRMRTCATKKIILSNSMREDKSTQYRLCRAYKKNPCS